MKKTIKDLIEKYSEAKFDRAKMEMIVRGYNNFIHKNDDHIQFFGGNLIGVYPIRFKSEDRDYWVEDVAEVLDIESFKEELHELPEINKEFAVSGNPVNYIFTWIIHKCLTADLPSKYKEMGAHAAMNMLQIKFLTSVDAKRFPYRADEALAQAVYEQLSRKSLLKLTGNWKALIEYRTDGFLSKKSIHQKALNKMDDNEEQVALVNDVQDRVRKSYNKLTSTFYELRDSEARILSQQAFITNLEGEQVLREFTNNIEDNAKKMHDILQYRNDFIKEELIQATLNLVESATESNLVKALDFISDNIDGKKRFDITKEVGALVVYIHQFMKSSEIDEKNIPEIVSRLRSGFRSHRTNNKAVLDIKEKVEDIVKRSISARHEATLSATKVAVLVYISLRILSIRYYNG